MVATIGSLVKDLPGVRASYTGLAVAARRLRRGLSGVSEAPPAPYRTLAVDRHHVSCGYYDVSPFDAAEQRLLATAIAGPNTPADGRDARVGYFDLSDPTPRFQALGSTTSWSWQLGPRLQWLDPVAGQVLYNRADGGRPAAIVQDVSSGRVIDELPLFVFATLAPRRAVLSVNFRRLFELRPGYGYPDAVDAGLDQRAPTDDGLWLFDLDSRQRALVSSLAEIASLDSEASMEGATHYLNHVQPNPSGTRVSFLHVWVLGAQRHVRLITCDPDGKEPFALINEGHVSHSCWRSDSEILAFATHRDTGRGIHLYSDRKVGHRRLFAQSIEKDGHPTFFPTANASLWTATLTVIGISRSRSVTSSPSR